MRKIVIMLCVLAAAMAQPAASQTTTVHPVDNGRALVNPDMGWMLYYYSNVPDNYGSKLEAEDTVDDFPGLSMVYLRLPWAFIEPEEGQYNWEWIDTPAQRWIEKGKKIGIRITATENWMESATPEWVFKAGATGYTLNVFDRDPVEKPYKEPDYDDPVFLEKLDNFLAAMAKRYDGNPNVAYVDIGHYGMWGEGHTIFTTRQEKRTWNDESKKRIIDLYCKHFTKTLLVMSDDFAGHRAPGIHFPIIDYALSKGVSLRDDSIVCGTNPPWYHNGMATLFWPTMPVVLEHGHYAYCKSIGSWRDDWMLKSIEDYHAAYMSIHYWPHEFLKENRALVDSINLRLGYRIQLLEAEWPKTVKKDEPFRLHAVWKNAGVAPCYPGGYPCFTIKSRQGGIVSVLVDDEFDVRTLDVGRPGEALPEHRNVDFTVAQKFTNTFGTFVRTCKPGKYQLYVSVGQADGTPVLELPYGKDDGHKRYLLGEITVTE